MGLWPTRPAPGDLHLVVIADGRHYHGQDEIRKDAGELTSRENLAGSQHYNGQIIFGRESTATEGSSSLTLRTVTRSTMLSSCATRLRLEPPGGDGTRALPGSSWLENLQLSLLYSDSKYYFASFVNAVWLHVFTRHDQGCSLKSLLIVGRNRACVNLRRGHALRPPLLSVRVHHANFLICRVGYLEAC